MSGTHPSEETLQQYVLDRAACLQEEIDHIGDCLHCQAQVAAYGLVITELDHRPVPAFDFDLSASVMEQVQAARSTAGKAPAAGVRERPVTPTVRSDSPPLQGRTGSITMLWAVVSLVIGVPAWLFRKSAYFMFTDMSPEFYWVLLTAAGIVVGLFILRLQRKYRDIINLINK